MSSSSPVAVRDVRGGVGILIALSVLGTATYVAQAVLIARVLGLLLAGQSLQDAVLPLLGLILSQVVRSVTMVAREVIGVRTAATVTADLRRRLYRTLLELGPGEVRRRRTGDLQAVLVDGVETVEPYVARFIPQSVAAVVSAVSIAVYLISLDPVVGLVIAVCGVIVPLVPWLFRRLTSARMEPWLASYRGLYAENLDALQGMTTLRLFGASQRHGRQLQDTAERFCIESIRFCAVVVGYVGVSAAFIGLGTALSVGIGAVRHASGILAAADLLVVLLLTRECFRPLREVQDAYHASAPARTALKAITALLDTVRPVRPPANPVPLGPGAWDCSRSARGTDSAALPTIATARLAPPITFEQVTFVYPDRREAALNGFDLRLNGGERVGLVGRSGAGKSTAISLLLRWHDPQQGRILIDGIDIRRFALPDLRSRIALVSQDAYLFHGTVRENILLGRPHARPQDVQHVLEAARADFVAHMPQGLDTVIGERGMRLSGGERQRLAIARALLSNASILVLDEATSNLDQANEAGISRALDEASHGRTTITIAHRLATVRTADRIAVVEDGQVVEQGDLSQLLLSGGAFASLAKAGRAGSSLDEAGVVPQ